MANHKATKKDVRQATKRRDRNKYYGKTTRNAIRELRATTDKKGASEQLPLTIAMVDKLAKLIPFELGITLGIIRYVPSVS